MNSKAKKALTLTVILVFAVWMINLQSGCAAKTLNVPADYPTITSALAHASEGDTINVQPGIYEENLQVNKTVTLQGENRDTTIIIGEGNVDRGARPVVALAANNAQISGFTIQSENYSSSNIYAMGIYVQADNCKIVDNTIKDCYVGIFSSAQAHLTVMDNNSIDSLKDGMRFYGAAAYTIQGNIIQNNAVSGLAIQGYQNIVENNTFTGNTRAIGLGSSYSIVYGNWMLQNTESGIYLAGSQNIIASNQIEGNKWSIYITPQLAAPHDNTFFQNNFVGNTYGVYVNESSPFEFWDKGTTVSGNYWSDYKKQHLDATASGDFYTVGYTVYEGATDNHPRTAPLDMHNLQDFPAANPPPNNITNGLVSYWSFDSIDATGVSPDSTGNNPAVLGSITAAKSYVPQTVPGQVGDALAFDGQQYVNVLESPSLEIGGEVTVDVWVNVQAYKDIPYNNILVMARRTPEALPTRTFGVAINGEAPQNSSSPEVGAIRGYVQTPDGLNEIVTTHSVVELGKWLHIVFTRSLQTGMHLYVDGQEQEVTVTSGVANPQGTTLRQTETYIGHDAICTIDELKLYNTAASEAQPLWMQWGLWAAMSAGIITAGLMLFALRRNRVTRAKPLGKV